MRYCKNCGSQADDNDIYCGYCGTKLQEDAAQENYSRKQDFGEESMVGADFSSQFDDDIGKEFNDNFGQSNNSSSARSNTSDKEFETYVEAGGSRATYTYNPTSNSDNSGRQKQKYNKDARDANTYGILSVVFGILGGILGIVFGIIGLVKAKKALTLCASGDYDGKPKANNGRVLSIVGLVLSVLGIIFWYII